MKTFQSIQWWKRGDVALLMAVGMSLITITMIQSHQLLELQRKKVQRRFVDSITSYANNELNAWYGYYASAAGQPLTGTARSFSSETLGAGALSGTTTPVFNGRVPSSTAVLETPAGKPVRYCGKSRGSKICISTPIAWGSKKPPPPPSSLQILSITDGSGAVSGGHFQGRSAFDINGTGFTLATTVVFVGGDTDATYNYINSNKIRVTSSASIGASATGLLKGSIHVADQGNVSNSFDWWWSGYGGVRNVPNSPFCYCYRCYKKLEPPNDDQKEQLGQINWVAGPPGYGCTKQCRDHFGQVYNCHN